MHELTKMITAYSSQYGDETEALILSLKEHHEKVALINPFSDFSKAFPESSYETFLGSKIGHTQEKPVLMNGVLSHYFLDRSSLLAPLLLPIQDHMKVLDMCAAPGGKLLAMAFRQLKNTQFVANELSLPRKNRLHDVVKSYLSPIEDLIRFAAKDASLIGLKQPEIYDAVLLDAPCSSEAHVIKDNSLLQKFSGIRKSLPGRQYAMLCSAVMATKKGGYIMYATCSINKNENEEIIKKLLKKKGGIINVVPLSPPFGDVSPFGVSILPHRHQAGPAFLSLLEKN